MWWTVTLRSGDGGWSHHSPQPIISASSPRPAHHPTTDPPRDCRMTDVSEVREMTRR